MAAACLVAAAAIATTAYVAANSGTDTAFRERVLEHEQLIADCMKERGFDYNVGVPEDVLAEEARQRAKAEGGDVAAATERAVAEAVDPNEELLAGLSPVRKAKWGDALYGDATRTGCHDLTYAEVWGIGLDDLAAKGQAFLAKVESDPAMVVPRRTYRDCMATRGHTLDRPNDLETMIGRNADGLADKDAEAYAAAVLADHEVCVSPYNKILAETYQRLSQ